MFLLRGAAPPVPLLHSLMRGGLRPSSALLPMGGPTRPTPGVPFVSRRKEPKACRGCAPGPPEGDASLPLQHIVLLPPQKGLCH